MVCFHCNKEIKDSEHFEKVPLRGTVLNAYFHFPECIAEWERKGIVISRTVHHGMN